MCSKGKETDVQQVQGKVPKDKGDLRSDGYSYCLCQFQLKVL